jgi:hypothetical protein
MRLGFIKDDASQSLRLRPYLSVGAMCGCGAVAGDTLLAQIFHMVTELQRPAPQSVVDRLIAVLSSAVLTLPK